MSTGCTSTETSSDSTTHLTLKRRLGCANSAEQFYQHAPSISQRMQTFAICIMLLLLFIITSDRHILKSNVVSSRGNITSQ